VLFSTKKTHQPFRPTISLVRTRHEENVDWQGYLDPQLIDSQELSTLDEGDLSSAVSAARSGAERPATKSQRIALELKQLEFEIHKVTRRRIPRLEYLRKGPDVVVPR
jgi:hypothetical protein